MFVHLTPEKQARSVRRGGIKPTRSRFPERRVVFAVPVTPNYFLSNQWLRELRRGGQRSFVAVHFRIPDDQPVLVGHYGGDHRAMTAAEAVATFLESDSVEGWEVLIPRRIDVSEIHAIRGVSQVSGWRYIPGAHGRKPCGCSYCQLGRFGGRKLRDAYEGKDG